MNGKRFERFVRTDAFNQTEAVHLRHPNVRQYDIHVLLLQPFQSFYPVMCRDDILEAIFFEHRKHDTEVHLNVIDKQQDDIAKRPILIFFRRNALRRFCTSVSNARQIHSKRASASQLALQRHLSAHALHQRTADCKTKPRAFHANLQHAGLLVRLKHLQLSRRLDTNARILHFKVQCTYIGRIFVERRT